MLRITPTSPLLAAANSPLNQNILYTLRRVLSDTTHFDEDVINKVYLGHPDRIKPDTKTVDILSQDASSDWLERARAVTAIENELEAAFGIDLHPIPFFQEFVDSQTTVSEIVSFIEREINRS